MFPCFLLWVLPCDLLWWLRCQKVSNDCLLFPRPSPSCVAKFCEFPECITHSCITSFLVLKCSLFCTPSRRPPPHCQGSFSFWAMPTHSLIDHRSRIIFPYEFSAASPPMVPSVLQGNTLFLHLLSGLLLLPCEFLEHKDTSSLYSQCPAQFLAHRSQANYFHPYSLCLSPAPSQSQI